LSPFGFLLAELSCLTLIATQSTRFHDVSEGNAQNIQKRGKRVTFGKFSAPGPTRKLRDEVTSSPRRASYFRKKQVARLGELLCNLHPSYPINRRERG